MPIFQRRPTRKTPSPAIPERLVLSRGDALPIAIRRNVRAKRMILRLTPDGGGVVVTAPRSARDETIAKFLDRHRSWVEDRVARAPEVVRIAHGALIPFRGGTLRLRHELSCRTTTFAIDDEGPSLRVGGDPEHFSRRVVDALKREARIDLQRSVDRHAATIGLKPTALTIKDTKSRWGSCSSDRRLAFSWRIVMAPPDVLDYLAAHEVAHFREMNHGPKFWALCRELCPSMDDGRTWLKRHGAGLHAISIG